MRLFPRLRDFKIFVPCMPVTKVLKNDEKDNENAARSTNLLIFFRLILENMDAE